MNIGEYSRRQQRALRPLYKAVRAILALLGVPVTEPQVAEMALYLYPHVVAARDLNAAITMSYLASQNLPADVVIPAPRPYPPQALTSTLTRISEDVTVAGEPVTEETRSDTLFVKAARTAVDGAVSKQAQEPARETIAHIGEDKNNSLGWARVLVGLESCSWCAMLASRHVIYASEETALRRDPRDEFGGYHTGCDCVAVPVPKDRSYWEGHEAQQKLNKLWQDSTEGYGGKEAVNAFRREWYAVVKAKQDHEFLVESVKSPSAAAAA